MGKTSNNYPDFSNASFQINGTDVATIKKEDGVIKSNYNMSKSEKNLYDNIQKNLSSSVANLFNISDATKKGWTEQLDAYKQSGIDTIESIYTPMERNLKNDIASRFGNLDNSAFMDKLKDITDNKSKAVAELSNNLTLMKSDLYKQELQNRINYISLLSGLSTGFENKMLSYLNLASQNSKQGNSYNQQAYNSSSSNGNLFGDTKLWTTAATTALSFI